VAADLPLALLNFPKGTLFNRAGHSEEKPGKPCILDKIFGGSAEYKNGYALNST
jgi:hypothetical protein